MKKIIIFAALCLSFLTACDKEDLGGSNIHVPEFDYNALSETDKYIYDHYTVPYNVEVVYRWNQGDVSSDDMRKNLVPPRESQVEPFLEMIEKVWVDTYTAEVGQQTLRSYIPKQILLVGSASYNDDGSTTEGTWGGVFKTCLICGLHERSIFYPHLTPIRAFVKSFFTPLYFIRDCTRYLIF